MEILIGLGFSIASVIAGWYRKKRPALILAVLAIIFIWAGMTGGS